MSKHWKRHVKESRTDIASETDCAILIRLEQWQYALFDPDTDTCHLALISSDDSTEVELGNNGKIHQFAIRHKIKWGREKCNVMRVGKHKNDEFNIQGQNRKTKHHTYNLRN